jgi:hypothetical protein
VIDTSRVHPVIFHFEGVIYEVVTVTKSYQTDGRNGWVFLWRYQKFERVICASDQISEPIINPTRALPVAMINELVVFNTYGLLLPAKLLIIEAADTHLVHFQAFVHFKDLEIRGPLCNLHGV